MSTELLSLVKLVGCYHGCATVDTLLEADRLRILQETPIEAGPPIIAVGVSLDGRLLTLQRSPAHLEFLSRDGPNMFLQA